MVSEPTEEEKQLAEQAKEYGKMRQQSVLGEEEGAESEEPPPPGIVSRARLYPKRRESLVKAVLASCTTGMFIV